MSGAAIAGQGRNGTTPKEPRRNPGCPLSTVSSDRPAAPCAPAPPLVREAAPVPTRGPAGPRAAVLPRTSCVAPWACCAVSPRVALAATDTDRPVFFPTPPRPKWPRRRLLVTVVPACSGPSDFVRVVVRCRGRAYGLASETSTERQDVQHRRHVLTPVLVAVVGAVATPAPAAAEELASVTVSPIVQSHLHDVGVTQDPRSPGLAGGQGRVHRRAQHRLDLSPRSPASAAGHGPRSGSAGPGTSTMMGACHPPPRPVRGRPSCRGSRPASGCRCCGAPQCSSSPEGSWGSTGGCACRPSRSPWSSG